jgi:hypothetical protein
MPLKGITSIRTQSGKLNLSKGGSTALYVDRSAATASDNNDGYSWDRPFETIQGALDNLEPWMEIYVRPGTYQENLVIDHENVVINGVIQSGLDRVEIAPLSGVALDIQVGYFELLGVSLVSSNSDALTLTGPGHYIHDCYIEVNTDGLSQYTGVLLNDADKFTLKDCHLNGRYGLDTVGVRLDGSLNASVDCYIQNNYFENFGTIDVSGQGLHLGNSQRCLVHKNIFTSCYNGVYCSLLANSLHSIIGNQFYSNASVDICDMNPDQQVSGITIRNNFFGYTGWYSDNNGDGIADVPIQCYYNYDLSPLASPHYMGPSYVPRMIV